MSRGKLLAAIILIVLLSPTMLQADTIPGGDVSGTWYAANSPYYIMGHITIPTDSTLTIEPGVVVDFQGSYRFQINSLLEAVGTETDSIHFLNSGGTWCGIHFENAPDSSHLAYCTVQNVNDVCGPHYLGAIKCYLSNPVITHCRISGNSVPYGGFDTAGGIFLYTSNPEISWCNISQNHTQTYGGGINCMYSSSPVIKNCDIRGNSTYIAWDAQGGGIHVGGGCNPVIINCTIEDNTSCNGGGIASGNGRVTITECTIARNLADRGAGGGIWISGGDMFITSSTLDSNRASINQIPYTGGPGGGIYADCDTISVDHCTFIRNRHGDPGAAEGAAIQTEGNTSMTLTNSIVRGGGLGFDKLIGLYGAFASISYCDYYEYYAAFMGSLPPGLGELTQVNVNGDSCDVYHNISLDPLFVDYANDDYHLLEDSPCIDAGDPAFVYDPDSTITDMGRYSFDHRLPNIEISDSLLDFDTVMVGEQSNLPLTIYNVGTVDTLILYDISCGFAVFCTDFDPADSLVLPGNSLQITVSFSPSDTTTVVDTLRITDNDHLCEVKLIGKGKESNWVDEDISAERPKEYALRPAYPNPFNPVTTIGFDLPKASEVTLRICNVLGQEVGTFALGRLSAGKYDYVWRADGLAGGVYFYRIEAGEFVQTFCQLLKSNWNG